MKPPQTALSTAVLWLWPMWIAIKYGNMPGTGLTARNTGSEALVNAFEVETAKLQRSEIEVLKKGQVPL